MVALFKILSFAVAAAAISNENVAQPAQIVKIVKRDYVQVTKDLHSISASCTALSKAIVSYTTSTQDLGPLFTAEANLESIIKKTTSDVKASSAATSSQAQTICDYFKNTLVPCIKSTLSALLGKKTVLTGAGAKAIVLSDLKALSSEAKALATALIAKAPADKTSCASVESSTVISLFNSAISAWNK